MCVDYLNCTVVNSSNDDDYCTKEDDDEWSGFRAVVGQFSDSLALLCTWNYTLLRVYLYSLLAGYWKSIVIRQGLKLK